MKKLLTLCAILLAGLFSCSKETVSIANPGDLGLESRFVDMLSGGGTFTIPFDAENLTAELTCAVAGEAASWCSAVIEGSNLVITVSPTLESTDRSTVVTLANGRVRDDIAVRQYGFYLLGDTGITPKSVTATSFETGFEPENTLNDDPDTYFNSKFGAYTDWPFQLTYEFEAGSEIDYIVYYPRQDNGNKWGSFGKYEIWANTHDNAEFVKLATNDAQEDTAGPTLTVLSTRLVNAKTVRFDVYTALQDRISAHKIEFLRVNEHKAKFDPLTVFTDLSCSELKGGITRADLDKIGDYHYRNLALNLLDDGYDPDHFRIQEYRPYQHPSVIAAINKTAQYSKSDNPTGIYATSGEELQIYAANIGNKRISITIRDLARGFGSTEAYALTDGSNKIVPKRNGLIYVNNFTFDDIPLILENETDKQYAKTNSVKIHFATGTVNGYYDVAKHTPEQGQEFLLKATYRDFDVLGKYAHVVWATQHLVEDNTELKGMIDRMDWSLERQHELMGLYKYHSPTHKRLFTNRQHITVDYTASSPNASDFRTVYTPGGYREVFTTEDGFRRRMWVIGHEVGHVNQTRPGFKWTAMTEVSNNLFALYMQEQYPNNPAKKLLNEIVDGKNLYERSRDSLVWKNVDKATGALIAPPGRAHAMECAGGQHDFRMAPLWQLKLYLTNVRGNKDFYPDLFEYYRVTPNLNTSATTQGVYQLEFIRQVCKAANMDLLDFFYAWGFLTPIDKVLNDYGNARFTITQAQIDALKAEVKAAGYAPYPTTNPPLYLIDDTNIHTFN